MIDDRHLYKPGETVSLKGWLRVIDPGKGGDIEAFAGAVSQVTYRVIDARNNQIGTGTAKVDAVGGFDTTFVLPSTPNLGYTRVELDAAGKISGHYSHPLQVEEFGGRSSRSTPTRARVRSWSAAAATSRSTRSTSRVARCRTRR